MPGIRVSVVIPTLTADARLRECLASLEQQTLRDFEVIVVDNSGSGLVKQSGAAREGTTVIESGSNIGFGAAINAGFRQSRAPFLATLNDDAIAHVGWLAALVRAMEARPEAGMCASQVRWFGEEHLDSAGMEICRDGSSKQRGHLVPAWEFDSEDEALFPSASAALYRRAMLEQIGLFDEDFFLYCEDTDLGLRARWAGWKCLYAPAAIVEHHYSHSAGRASRLKAYYVERNRLFVLVKNFPAGMLAAAPFVTAARYWWHFRAMLEGRGTAAQFRREGNSGLGLVLVAIRAHAALVLHLRRLWQKRKTILGGAKLSAAAYTRLLRAHSISARRVAEL